MDIQLIAVLLSIGAFVLSLLSSNFKERTVGSSKKSYVFILIVSVVTGMGIVALYVGNPSFQNAILGIAMNTPVPITTPTGTPIPPVISNVSSRVKCGDIIEAEFRFPIELQTYSIDLMPGDAITVSATRIGFFRNLSIGLLDPTDQPISLGRDLFPDTTIDSMVVGATGQYTIIVSNALLYPNLQPQGESGGIGRYILTVGCIVRDGTVIEPGDDPGIAASIGSTPISIVDFGFPGLAPFDLSNALLIPLISGTTMPGRIQAYGDFIIGYSFDGNVGQVVDITFLKEIGNQSLGVAIIRDRTTEVVMFTALTSSPSFNSRFTLPVSGSYILAVFPIDLMPPVAPEQTSYTVTLTFVE